MRIFTHNNKERKTGSEDKMFGAYIDPSLYQTVTIYCMAQGISISEFLRQLLLKNQSLLNKAKEQLADQILAKYEIKGTYWNSVIITDFLSMVEEELCSRGVSEQNIEAIIEIAKDKRRKSNK